MGPVVSVASELPKKIATARKTFRCRRGCKGRRQPLLRHRLPRLPPSFAPKFQTRPVSVGVVSHFAYKDSNSGPRYAASDARASIIGWSSAGGRYAPATQTATDGDATFSYPASPFDAATALRDQVTIYFAGQARGTP
jgi:hypothetical protein